MKIIVKSDGRTVWVNRKRCLARFCPISREYFIADTITKVRCHNNFNPTLLDWKDFVKTVKQIWGAKITNKYKPTYIQ